MSWVTEGLEFVPVSSTRHHIIPTIILVYNLISLPTIIKLCSVTRNIQTLQIMHQNCCVLGCWVLFRCFQHSCYFSSGKVLTKTLILSSAWPNDVWHGSEHFKSLFKALSAGSPSPSFGLREGLGWRQKHSSSSEFSGFFSFRVDVWFAGQAPASCLQFFGWVSLLC